MSPIVVHLREQLAELTGREMGLMRQVLLVCNVHHRVEFSRPSSILYACTACGRDD